MNKEKVDLFTKDWLAGRETFTITTSGSTGIPKTIEITRGQMIASAKKTIEALDLRQGMTALVCLDADFIAGKMMVVRSLLAEMKLIVAEPVANPFASIENIKIDFTALVPYQLDAILKSPQRERLNDVGKIILGGAAINEELLNDIQHIKPACYATFGMTETLSHIALQKLNGVDKQDYFETLTGVEVSKDDRDCLVIKTDYLESPVVTNDIVELIDAGRFRWLGRWDNVINTGGVKVMPEKIEKAVSDWMMSNGKSNRFFVTGVAHQQLGTQVTLVIEGELNERDESNLLVSLRDTLHKYEVPKEVYYSRKFEMTPTQKVNRSASLKNAAPRPG